MRFLVVTPCWNAADWIGDTVRSVAGQTVLADPSTHLTYVVVDGGSTDDTVAVARAAWTPHPRAALHVVSEPDRGMYDALVKGLRGWGGDADVVSYINAGDYYSPQCLAVVAVCFERFGVRWLTGTRTLYSEDGAAISSRVPFKYDRALVRSGHYGPRGAGGAIQQESTFWSRELLDRVDLDRLRTLRLAGDLYLWTEFARHAELVVVAAHLGGFRFHGGHLSDAMDRYDAEALGFLAPRRPGGRWRAGLHEALGLLPVSPSSRFRLRDRLPGRHPVISWKRTDGWTMSGT